MTTQYNKSLMKSELRAIRPQLPTLEPHLVTYTRGKDLSGSMQGAGGIGGLLARSETSNLQSPHAYYHADGNGNVTCMVNPQNAIVAKYHYDPYGNMIAASGALADANLYRFSSKEWHTQSGLVYYLYRYYEPNLQRWMNRDPIKELGGVNLYGYCYNSPIRKTDPLGLDSCSDELAACLQEARENRDWNICELGEAYRNQKQAVQTAEEFWQSYCATLGAPNSPQVIGCNQAVSAWVGIYGGAVEVAYWPLLTGILAEHGAEVGVCYTSYAYCKANKIGIF